MGKKIPIVCEECYGFSDFVRMLKVRKGGVCHISGLVYDSFRIKADVDSRYKRTIISREVAVKKNVCQICLMDLACSKPLNMCERERKIFNRHNRNVSRVCSFFQKGRCDRGEHCPFVHKRIELENCKLIKRIGRGLQREDAEMVRILGSFTNGRDCEVFIEQ